MDEIKEECGVAAIYVKNPGNLKEAPSGLVAMLTGLQHRGQKSAGIGVYNPFSRDGERRLNVFRKVGMVSDAFKINNLERSKQILEGCEGVAGIGHVRYSTSGDRESYQKVKNEAQPFWRPHMRPWKRFALAFNGNIANHDELVERIESRGLLRDTTVDTEVLVYLISLNLDKLSERRGDIKIKPNLFDVVEEVMNELDGAYNVVSMFADGDLLVFRDKHGIRPLVYGKSEKYIGVASESFALERIGIWDCIGLNPGSVMIISKDGIVEKQIFEPEIRECHFEDVYFSKAASKNNGEEIRAKRVRLGEELAEIEPMKNNLGNDYIVVPAPKTAIPAAEGYAERLKLKLVHAIEKIEDLRGFINDRDERARIMDSVYVVYESAVNGKKIILVDDSLIRGDTSKRLIEDLRKKGAKEVHLRLTESQVKYPCFYGVDYPSREELFVNKYNDNLEQIAKAIGADSVVFQSMEGLVRAMRRSSGSLCLACLNGEYPTEHGKLRSGCG